MQKHLKTPAFIAIAAMVFLAICTWSAVAFADNSGLTAVIDCGTLSGSGRAIITTPGGEKHELRIDCGQRI